MPKSTSRAKGTESVTKQLAISGELPTTGTLDSPNGHRRTVHARSRQPAGAPESAPAGGGRAWGRSTSDLRGGGERENEGPNRPYRVPDRNAPSLARPAARGDIYQQGGEGDARPG